MKVSLSAAFAPHKMPGTVVEGEPLLDPGGPLLALGWVAAAPVTPIVPAAATLFGPRGVCLPPDGSLWVADTGHHRLLGWRRLPSADNAPADFVIGQRDFSREGRNAGGAPGAATLNVPTGIASWRGGLAVADAWNHRVLIWREVPSESHHPADVVLGQASAGETLANRGADRPDAASLHWPYGIAEIGGRLAVCDTGNRRVLVWDDPQATGQPADLVLGQADFVTRDENAGGEVSARSMRWPHAAALWQGRMAVADAGNNRVMLWDRMPATNGAPSDDVLGQAAPERCDHNMSAYYPSDRTLNMPYALAPAGGTLVVADTANSRLLGWEAGLTGAAARRLSGQPDFAAKGDNRWGTPVRDSLCWPYGLAVRGGTVAVADSGNNRVLIWSLAP